jgi:O-antigen ligase
MLFRGEGRTPRPLHPLEKALLIVTGIHMCFLPWALGGMTFTPWPLWISLGLGLIGLVLALWPRHYTEAQAREGEFKLMMWPKLVRFPIFWLGLALLTFMTAQALNPAWTYFNDGKQWMVIPLSHVNWLPTSIRAPMNGVRDWEDMNAWRMILLYAAPWLTVCSLWVGITRRITVLALLSTLAVDGAVLALVGIVERVKPGNGKILWITPNPNPNNIIVSSFVYKNHAGAYFNLMLAVCLALAFWHFTRAARRMERSNPAPAFFLCALLVALMTLLSHSRTATILMFVFLLVSAIWAVARIAMFGVDGRSPAMLWTMAAALGLATASGVYYLDKGESLARIERLSGQDYTISVENRMLVDRAAWDMAMDKPITGWGAGSFKYYFWKYQWNYPQLMKKAEGGNGWLWEYAHDDYVQIFDELGLVGVLIFAAGGVYWFIQITRHGLFSRPHVLLLSFGLLVLMVHSGVDFQLYCPAVLVTWCVLWALTARWVAFEDSKMRD